MRRKIIKTKNYVADVFIGDNTKTVWIYKVTRDQHGHPVAINQISVKTTYITLIPNNTMETDGFNY